MKNYELTVLGAPVAFSRPRWNSKTRKVFNENNYSVYKGKVRGHAARITSGLLDGPLEAEIDFYLPIPDSWTKKRKDNARSGLELPTKKPDVDNYAKSIFDACNEVFYKDDSQIVRVTARKWYSDEPRIEFRVRQIDAS